MLFALAVHFYLKQTLRQYQHNTTDITAISECAVTAQVLEYSSLHQNCAGA